mgnify:FL=1
MLFRSISSLEEHRENPIIKLNVKDDRPPLIFGLYEYQGKIIFTPFYINKNKEFNIDTLKNKIQIIAYLAKSVPNSFKSKSILDLEALAILTALHSLQRYISGTKCILLTDSRVLYYLFCQRISDSCTKIKRWVLKLLSDYPTVQLHFIRTTANLADYLTRQGLPEGDLPKLNLKSIRIDNFHDKLPKKDFSFQEWAEYCAEHPEHLKITDEAEKIINCSFTKVIDSIVNEEWSTERNFKHRIYSTSAQSNLEDYKVPLEILKERLSRAEIIKRQKVELSDIYDQCLASDDFEYEEEASGTKYKLLMDLLMIDNGRGKQIYIPDSLIGPLLSYTHLLGHQGRDKLWSNLHSYYFKNKYKSVQKFVACCYSCFLVHGPNRKTPIGNYPVPSYPFEEISVDLAESLNTVSGYQNLLIVQCVLTDFILIFPLRSKTAKEVSTIFLHGVLQPFNVTKIHQDNGSCFRNLQWLKLLASMNIQVINSSANNPSSRGKAERAVQQVKTLMKKMLAVASSDTLNWELLPYLVSKTMNHTVTPRTGFKPAEMIFGRENMAESFLDREKILPIHHTVTNSKTQINRVTEEIRKMTDEAREKLIELRQIRHEEKNKNRIKREFKVGDICFCLDRYRLEGNTRPLRTKFFPSPYVILKVYFTTCLIRRLADSFVTLYSMDDLKVYKGVDPMFSSLPPEVNKVLLNKFEDLIDSDFKTILKFDPLDIPDGIQLLDTVDPKLPDEDLIFEPLNKQNKEDDKSNQKEKSPEQEQLQENPDITENVEDLLDTDNIQETVPETEARLEVIEPGPTEAQVSAPVRRSYRKNKGVHRKYETKIIKTTTAPDNLDSIPENSDEEEI